MTSELLPIAQTARASRSRWLLSALLIAGAALFAIGVAGERRATDHHSSGETTHVEGTNERTETTPVKAGSETSSENVLGLNLESGSLVVVTVAMSLVFALLAWRTNIRLIFLAFGAFAALFAAFDIAELVHQIEESRVGIAVLAAIIALVHVATTVVAAQRVSITILRGEVLAVH